ncbi:hypothetical protein PINS_up003280 [Pythium insidiosum]|nr:hypothetical protein PINS_up003280 [Pythium insidiosum]
MQFQRRRKPRGDAAAPGLGDSSAMNNFFGTVGSPIKMSTFERHMEKRDRRGSREEASPLKPPSPAPAVAAAAAAGAHRHHHHRHKHPHHPHHRAKSPSPAPSPVQSPPPAPIDASADHDDHVSANPDAVTLDNKKKLRVPSREAAAAAAPAVDAKPSKNDILTVHGSSEEEVDGGENVATIKNKGGRERRRSTEFIGQPVEPVEQLQLEGARKAKIPIFLSAWFNADGVDKNENKDPNKKQEAEAAHAKPAPAVEAKPAPAAPQQQATTPTKAVPGLPNGRTQTIDFKDIALGRVLGEGAFGKVYEGKLRGKSVAVKVLVCQDLRSDILKEFQGEVEIMTMLRHPNICRLLGVCMDPPNRALIVELMQRGSLWGVLRTHRKTLTLDMRARFIYDTAKGMSYLHHFDRPILHRDLKSPNLLVDKNYNIKLSDFGLARVKAHVQTMTGNCGTVQWMAPEVLGNQKYTEKADVFSFGIVIWEIMTGECPYDGMSQIQAALGVPQPQPAPERSA